MEKQQQQEKTYHCCTENKCTGANYNALHFKCIFCASNIYIECLIKTNKQMERLLMQFGLIKRTIMPNSNNFTFTSDVYKEDEFNDIFNGISPLPVCCSKCMHLFKVKTKKDDANTDDGNYHDATEHLFNKNEVEKMIKKVGDKVIGSINNIFKNEIEMSLFVKESNDIISVNTTIDNSTTIGASVQVRTNDEREKEKKRLRNQRSRRNKKKKKANKEQNKININVNPVPSSSRQPQTDPNTSNSQNKHDNHPPTAPTNDATRQKQLFHHQNQPKTHTRHKIQQNQHQSMAPTENFEASRSFQQRNWVTVRHQNIDRQRNNHNSMQNFAENRPINKSHYANCDCRSCFDDYERRYANFQRFRRGVRPPAHRWQTRHFN